MRAHRARAVLLSCTAITSLFGVHAAALGAPATGAPVAADQTSTLSEIVVTAQKREQSLQDVPISMTAVTPKLLQANRITNVLTLGSVVPNLSVRPSAGGVSLPAFTMRGVTSYGVVPGSDKEISIYIDGVYIGSATGSAFELPDLERIEVLRGPQGTLFGRNATAGAISIVTRDPPGKFGAHQELTFGNYDQFRSKTRIDLPEWGPFSASISYVRDQRKGDIKNLGAGTVWTKPEPGIGEPAVQVSPKTLGDKAANNAFVAVKFEPNNDFKATYKFDYSDNHFTAAGVAAVGVNPAALGPAGGFLAAVIATQATPVLFDATGRRPKYVNNSWTTPGYSQNYGHNLTIDYQVNDQLSLKNILAYRYSFIRSQNQLDGFGGLSVTPGLAALVPSLAPIVGSPFGILLIQQQGKAKQWSDETQLNYKSRYLDLTAGLLYFHLDTVAGAAPGLSNVIALSPIPFGVVGPGSSTSYNRATSYAAYVQAEGHVTSQLDLVGGVRITKDDKSGTFDGPTGPISFTYRKTKPSYSLGVNYKPVENVMTYLKYSNAFVSGGAVGPIAFKPEVASSWEVGVKSDLLDRRLRANAAVFDVRYKDLQSAQGGLALGHPEIGTVIADLGSAVAKGFELETSAVPVRGLTFGLGVGYTDFRYTSVNPILGLLGVPGSTETYLPTLQPKWTANLSGEYDTEPLFGEARMAFRMDASWRSKERADPYVQLDDVAAFDSIKYSPATWLVNARVALQRIALGRGSAEIALWANNLTDSKVITFPDIFSGFAGGTEFQQARTFGVDLIYDY